jgi:hypothetical protein
MWYDVALSIYYVCRYEVEALAKLIGGSEYQYALRGNSVQHRQVPVDASLQIRAIQQVNT